MTPIEAKKVLLAFARQFKDVPVIGKYAFNGKQLQTLSEAIGVTFDDVDLEGHYIRKRKQIDVMSEYPVEEAENADN